MTREIVEKYIKTKRFTDKVNRPLREEELLALDEVVKYYGISVFTRNKSPLESRIINDRIPLMIKHNVVTIVENLEKSKHVRRNSLEHYELIYGDFAKEIYLARTKKSLQCEDNFVARHGEQKGRELWKEFSAKKSKTSAFTNSRDWYVKQFGEEVGNKKWDEVVLKRHRKRWTIEGLIETHGKSLGEQIYKNMLQTRQSYKGYARRVHALSHQVYEDNIDIINPNRYPRTLCGVDGGWQLDHIKPIKECYIQGMSVEDASKLENLRMLPWKENLARNKKARKQNDRV